MQVRIPLAALAIDDTQPQAGDPVDLTASGKLVSVDGDTGLVEVDTVNGAPLGTGEPDADDMTEDDLRTMAEQADALPFGNP